MCAREVEEPPFLTLAFGRGRSPMDRYTADLSTKTLFSTFEVVACFHQCWPAWSRQQAPICMIHERREETPRAEMPCVIGRRRRRSPAPYRAGGTSPKKGISQIYSITLVGLGASLLFRKNAS